MKIHLPEEIIERIFDYVTSHKNRNDLALVCKSWCRIERQSRRGVFVGNCLAISPERTIATFPRLRSLTLKGSPPGLWEALAAGPWIEALAAGRVALEALRLKRMNVSDASLDLLSRSFPSFKSLVIEKCEGFTTNGLACIALNCRYLRVLDLQESEINGSDGQWLSCFPETFTSLESLDFRCLSGEVNLTALVRLVARSPNLKTLRVNRFVPINTLWKILVKAPQLVDLGTGSVISARQRETYGYNYVMLIQALLRCKSIRSLSGFMEVSPQYFHAFYPVFSELKSLNLSYATGLQGTSLVKLACCCPKLRCLRILDCIGDNGLGVISSSCKELRELRILLSRPYGANHVGVTHDGLLAVSTHCPNLQTLVYRCPVMSNAALITVARNCPNLVQFRVCMRDPTKPDPLTSQPLDEGFGEIVRACKSLKRLSLSGLLTDQVFLYIGFYAENLEALSIAFASKSDNGMSYVLNGCTKLKKLEIQRSQFGDALLEDVGKYEKLRCLSMSSSRVTIGGCDTVAEKMPTLSFAITKYLSRIGKYDGDEQWVDKMYMYRRLVEREKDVPQCVGTL